MPRSPEKPEKLSADRMFGTPSYLLAFRDANRFIFTVASPPKNHPEIGAVSWGVYRFEGTRHSLCIVRRTVATIPTTARCFLAPRRLLMGIDQFFLIAALLAGLPGSLLPVFTQTEASPTSQFAPPSSPPHTPQLPFHFGPPGPCTPSLLPVPPGEKPLFLPDPMSLPLAPLPCPASSGSVGQPGSPQSRFKAM